MSAFVDAVVVPEPECSLKFDILLIVDGSESVSHYGKLATGDGDYYRNKVYNLVKNIMALFKLGKNKVEIGLLFFGSNDMQSIKNQVNYNFFKEDFQCRFFQRKFLELTER